MDAPNRTTVVAWLAAWLAVSAWLLSGAHREMLDWDEVDYVSAADLGVVANALDRGGMRPFDFVRFARSKVREVAPALPEGYDEGRDPLVLRHYHPPGFVFALAPVRGARAEWSVRLPLLVGAGLFVFGFLYALQVVTGGASALVWVVGASTAAWLAVLGFGRIQGHGWLAVGVLALALGSGGGRGGARPPARWLTVGALAWCGLMLESAAFLWAVAAGLGLARSEGRGRRPWKDVALTFGAAAAVVMLAWPGAFLQASPLRVAGLYAYRLLLGEEYMGLAGRLGRSVAPFLPLLVLVPLLVRRRRAPETGREEHGAVRALWVLGACYAVLVAAASLAPQYLLAGVAPLAVLLVSRLSEVGRHARAGLGTAFLLAVVAFGTLPPARPRDDAARADFQALADRARGRTLWADGGHIVRRYLPPGQDVRHLTVSRDGSELTRRSAGMYHPVTASDLGGALVAVMSHRDASPTRAGPLSGCRRTELGTFVLYDC